MWLLRLIFSVGVLATTTAGAQWSLYAVTDATCDENQDVSVNVGSCVPSGPRPDLTGYNKVTCDSVGNNEVWTLGVYKNAGCSGGPVSSANGISGICAILFKVLPANHRIRVTCPKPTPSAGRTVPSTPRPSIPPQTQTERSSLSPGAIAVISSFVVVVAAGMGYVVYKLSRAQPGAATGASFLQ